MSDSGSALPPPPVPPNDAAIQPDDPDPKKQWWKRWWAIALGVVLVLVVIAGVFGPDGENGEDAEPADVSSTVEVADTTTPEVAAEVTEPTTPDPDTTAVPATTALPETTVPATTTEAPTTVPPTTTSTTTTVAPTTTSTLPPLPGFGSGVVLVGVDVDPGIYVAQVPNASFGCYWERLTDLTGDFDAIITNANVNPGAQTIVELLPTDEAFSSTRCGDWTIYLPPEQPTNTFGEGTWIVNQQIVPGRYRSTGPGPDDFGCYWERLNGVTGEFETILANANTDGPTIVDISPSDFAFSSTRCGDWSLAQ
jgi:hypothetical protein